MVLINVLDSFKPSLIYTTKLKKLQKVLLIFYILFYLFPSIFGEVIYEDDIVFNDFSITEFSTSHGYVCEIHKNIVTEDGYILDLHRIPHGLNAQPMNRIPILLMHGLGGCAENFIITGPDRGLAYLFADRGYDVWVGNSRGSPHSKRHLELDPASTEYWDFSWHEIGMFDLPVIIDHILETTGKNKIFYSGHSQGTTVFFVLMSNKPEYNEHIELMLALAPAAFEGHPPYLQQPFVGQYMNALEYFRVASGLGETGQHTRGAICNDLTPQQFCNFMVLIILTSEGLDLAQVDYNNLDILPKLYGVSKSIRQILHYHQSEISGGFNHYDFGRQKNLQKYNAETPPPYDLGNVIAPVALFYGQSDVLATRPNVERLGTVLPNVALQYLIPYQGFTHLDFILAKDINTLLYNEMFQFIDDFRASHGI